MATRAQSFKHAIEALFVKRFGLAIETPTDYGIDNGTYIASRNAANTADVPLIGLDAEDNVNVGGAYAVQPTLIPWIFRAVPNAACVTTRFHIANYSGRIAAITHIHNVAGNHADAVTGHISKETSGQAPGAGTSVMSGTFNLKATANTKATATLSTNSADLDFVAGDMFSFTVTGDAQTLSGVLAIVWVQPDVPALDFSWYSAAVTSQDQSFAIANRSYPIRAIRFAHAVAEATDTTANVQVTVDDGTEAAGAGTDLLTNDAAAGFDLNGTINVPQVGGFAATTLVANERLSVDWNSTQTEGAGVCITVTVIPQAGRLEISDWIHDTDVADHWFFDSDRDYEVWDGRQIHAVAAGGTSTANIEKASGTTNASGGAAILGTAWDLNATAATVQVAAFTATGTKAALSLAGNDRLATEFNHTEQSLTGFCQTISLLAR